MTFLGKALPIFGAAAAVAQSVERPELWSLQKKMQLLSDLSLVCGRGIRWLEKINPSIAIWGRNTEIIALLGKNKDGQNFRFRHV